MGWEDDTSREPGDDEPLSSYLPPEDRLWRHPAEVGAAARLTTTAEVKTPWRRSVLLGGNALLLTAVLVTSTFVALGDDPGPQTNPAGDAGVTEPVAFDPAREGEPEAAWPGLLTDQVGEAIARVRVTSAAGTSFGSGFFFRRDGYLLTSTDLVDGATSIAVITADGEVHDAELTGADARSGVAVVRIDRDEGPIIRLRVFEVAAVGDRVLILDPNTAAENLQVTGIAATDRCLDPTGSDNAKQGLISLSGLLRPTATGAPVLDSNGFAIGLAINLEDTEDAYAVPIAYAGGVIAPQLVADGRAVRTWIGIDGSNDLQTPGVEIRNVREDSPARAIGLLPGDVITVLNDVPVATICELNTELRRHAPGKSVSITYQRDDHQVSMALTLGVQPG